MVAHVVRAIRAPHWLAFFVLVVFCWTVLFMSSVPDDIRAAGRVYGSDILSGLCLITPDAAGFLRLTAMWSIMSIAMMAPTVLPAFATYEDLGFSAPIDFAKLVGGFLVAWFGFSVLAAALQLALFRAGVLSPFGELRSGTMSAALLMAAGLYQFSAAKSACLAKCRAPLTFFMTHWDEGAWRNGLRLGLACLGCCWALMLLALVGGAMTVAFMGLATVIMITEKLPDIGEVVTRPLGGLLVAAGLWTGAVSLGIWGG